MRILVIVIAMIFLWMGSWSSEAAQSAYSISYATTVPGGCQSVWRCAPRGCAWHRVCRRCGGYFCYSLYGAYGPYGGVPYWGAYTGRLR